MGLQLGLSAGLRLSLETRCRLRLGAFFQYAPWRLRGQVWVLFRKTQPACPKWCNGFDARRWGGFLCRLLRRIRHSWPVRLGEGGINIWVLSASFRFSIQAAIAGELNYIANASTTLAYAATLSAHYEASCRVGCGFFSFTFSVSGSLDFEVSGHTVLN